MRIQASSARVTTQHFVFLLGTGAAGVPARLGITASKQVGDAVARNRSKRLVREAFRRDAGWLCDGVDLVVIVRSGAAMLGLAGVQAEWARVRGVVARRAVQVVASGAGAA